MFTKDISTLVYFVEHQTFSVPSQVSIGNSNILEPFCQKRLIVYLFKYDSLCCNVETQTLSTENYGTAYIKAGAFIDDAIHI